MRGYLGHFVTPSPATAATPRPPPVRMAAPVPLETDLPDTTPTTGTGSSASTPVTSSRWSMRFARNLGIQVGVDSTGKHPPASTLSGFPQVYNEPPRDSVPCGGVWALRAVEGCTLSQPEGHFSGPSDHRELCPRTSVPWSASLATVSSAHSSHSWAPQAGQELEVPEHRGEEARWREPGRPSVCPGEGPEDTSFPKAVA